MKRYVLSSVLMLLSTCSQLPSQSPPQPSPGEILVPSDTNVAFALSSFISTKNSQPGDKFYGEVIYPVAVSNRIVIPAGSHVQGTITEIKRAGRIKGKAELMLRFDSLMLPNGVTKEFHADLHGIHSPSGNFLRRELERVQGDSSKGRDAGIIVDAGTSGALIGAVAGQGKGVAIGGGAGALAGVVAVLLTRGKDIELGRDTDFDLVLKKGVAFSEPELDFSNVPPSYQRPAISQRPASNSSRRRWGWPRFPVPYAWPY